MVEKKLWRRWEGGEFMIEQMDDFLHQEQLLTLLSRAPH